MELFRNSGQQFDTLILPAISTGNGLQSPEFFYSSFASVYAERLMVNSSSVPKIIFAVYGGDWNRDAQSDQTSASCSIAIQDSLAACMEKIAEAWKQQVDATIAIQKTQRTFFSTVAGLFLGLAIVPIAFPAFLGPHPPQFGIAALLGYLVLAYALASSLLELADKLTIALTMAEITLLSVCCVPLLYLVHTAEEAAKERFSPRKTRDEKLARNTNSTPS